MQGWREAIFKTDNYYVASMYPGSQGVMFSITHKDRFNDDDEKFLWNFTKNNRYAPKNTCEKQCDGATYFSQYLKQNGMSTSVIDKKRPRGLPSEIYLPQPKILGLVTYTGDKDVEAQEIISAKVHCSMFTEDPDGKAAREVVGMFRQLIMTKYPDAKFHSNIALEAGDELQKAIRLTTLASTPGLQQAAQAAINTPVWPEKTGPKKKICLLAEEDLKTTPIMKGSTVEKEAPEAPEIPEAQIADLDENPLETNPSAGRTISETIKKL